MNGTIKEINRDLRGRSGKTYHRVRLKMEDGSTAFTDVVPAFRNYKRWEPILEPGNKLSGLTLIRAGKVNADSNLKLVGKEDVTKTDKSQMQLF